MTNKPKVPPLVARDAATTAGAQTVIGAEVSEREAKTEHLRKGQQLGECNIQQSDVKSAQRAPFQLQEAKMAAPKKRVQSSRGRFVYVYYGIDPKTLTVKAVGQTRDGTLKARDESTTDATHGVTPDRIGIIEVTIAFGLVDVIAIPGNLDSSDNPGLKRLEEKAAAMRAARQQQSNV